MISIVSKYFNITCMNDEIVQILFSFYFGLIFGTYVKQPIYMVTSLVLYEIILMMLFGTNEQSFMTRCMVILAYIFGYIIIKSIDKKKPFKKYKYNNQKLIPKSNIYISD